MQSYRAVHPPVPLTLPNKYALDSRLAGQPEATEGTSRATLAPLQPPDGVLSRDFGQFNIDTVPSSYYQRSRSSTGDHLNPLAPPLHPGLPQAPTDPTLFQHQNQGTSEVPLFRQQIRHLPSDAASFCHQSEQSQFQAATGTPTFLQNQNDAAVMYQHQNQVSTEPAIYQRSSEQPLYHHSNQPAAETSLYHQSQASADNSLYPHPNQRVSETAVFRDPHQSMPEGPLYHQSLEATMFPNHRPLDASVFHHVNQATAEASLFHPNHPPTDAAVYHTQEAAIYHHQNSLSGPTSNFIHQSSSATASQATAFFHPAPAAAENSNIFRFSSQAGDTHFQRQNQINPPFYHIQNQAAVETQYHHQQNQTEPPFHVLQNQRPVESQLSNSGPVDSTFYPHRNVDMGEPPHCQQNPISAETQVLQFQNQSAQDSQLHQHSRVPSEAPLYQYQGQVPSEPQLHQQNHSTIDVSIVSYQNHISQEPQIHHRSHADMSVYHYPNQIAQDMQLRHQTQATAEAPQFHFQNQPSLGTLLHPPSMTVSKSQSHRHQKLTCDEGSQNFNMTRFQSRSVSSNSDATESKHYGHKRPNDSFSSSMKIAVDLSDMQRAFVKDACRTASIPATGALLCQSNYNSAASAKPNDFYTIKERPDTNLSWQKSRKADSNICQKGGFYSHNEDKMKSIKKQKDLAESKPNSVFRMSSIAEASAQEIKNTAPVDAKSSYDSKDVDFSLPSAGTCYKSAVGGNISSQISLPETDVLAMVHTMYGDGVTSKVQSREEQHKNEFNVILESQEESASNQTSVDVINIFDKISDDKEISSSKQVLEINEAFISDSSNEVLVSVPSIQTECTKTVSICCEVEEKDELVSSENDRLYQSSEKSDETITLCNAHLLPRPPDILLTLPVVTESENITLQFETSCGQPSTEIAHPPQDGNDESGLVMGLLFEEINSSPPTPPLMTPPCVTPPPSTPPRNWPSTSPLSCSPSSPKYATPAFLSPLSSSPRTDEVEPLVGQSDDWGQSQSKNQPMQEIKSIDSMADAIDKLIEAVANEKHPEVSAATSSSFPGNVPSSTEHSQESHIAEEPNEACCSLSINKEVEVNPIDDSTRADVVLLRNLTSLSGFENKTNPGSGLTDATLLSPLSEDRDAQVKSDSLLEIMDNLNSLDICKTQIDTIEQSENVCPFSGPQSSMLFSQTLPSHSGQSTESDSDSKEKSSDHILTSIPPLIAVASLDTSLIESSEVLPVAVSQLSEENILMCAISPMQTPAFLGTTSECDGEDQNIDKSLNSTQDGGLYSNSESTASMDKSANSLNFSVTQSVLKDEIQLQNETSMNHPETTGDITMTGVSSVLETELPPSSGIVSSEQELPQVDSAAPIPPLSANQPQGTPPAPIMVSGFLTTPQCLKL